MRDFLITFFLGMFGIHKFIKGDHKMGLLYLFTVGLFGFGWFFDSALAFIAMMNDKVNELHQPKKTNNSTSNNYREIEPIDNVTITTSNKLEQVREDNSHSFNYTEPSSKARSNNKDYIKAMLLNRFKKPGPILTSNNQYPYWFVEQLGINDISQRYQNYLNEGYLEQAADKDILMKLLKKDLEDISITLNLPKTGNKIDLVNRITSVSNYSDTTKFYTGSSIEFILSKKGKIWLDFNRDILSLSTNYRINVDDYMDIRNSFISNGVKPDFNQISLIFYQKEIKKTFDEQRFWEISSLLKEISAMYMMNDDLVKQLDSLVLAFIMDLTCLGMFGRIENSSTIIYRLHKYRQLSNFSEFEILNAFEKMTTQLKLPYQKYPFSVMSKMIRDYHQYGEIPFEKYERFTNKPPFLTEFGEYWQDPRILHNY